jgi:hypothetical protein
MKKTSIGIALSAATLTASAGGLTIGQYQLSDHPAGGENPPPYGLRLDGILGAGTQTLSIDFHNDTVLTVSDNGGNLEINITGTLYGGEVDGMGGYVSAASYDAVFNYVVNVTDEGNGWAVNGFDASNGGTLTNQDTNAVTEVYGMNDAGGLVLAFLADGHRLTGDDTTWVGRGWITDQPDGTDPHAGFRDWLFKGELIPAPSSFALLGLGGLVASRRRR